MAAIDFRNIEYLKLGNSVQRNSYRLLKKYDIINLLQVYHPIVVGTIPINIDIEGSDVDIILCTDDFNKLEMKLRLDFSRHEKFQLQRIEDASMTCSFCIEGQLFELYATDQETERQNGYLHMMKEYEIIQSKGRAFAEQVRALKRQGIKTEPAFCRLLGIEGNAYEALLNYSF